jgi:hypothetical protein
MHAFAVFATLAATTASAQAPKGRLAPIVDGILAAWDTADVVCLGEDHGRKNDSDLRLAVIRHPDFVRKVNVIMVEFANSDHQDILDRLALDGEDVPRAELSRVWRDTSAAETWASPVYEEFLRAVRAINLPLPRNKRIRLLGGDSSLANRGKFIREAVSREILEKKLKGLAIYGAGHCECRGGGFPGEIGDKYPGRIWAAFSFYQPEEGRRVFHLGAEPRLIPITGTPEAKLPAVKMFFLGRYNDPATLGDIANAIVYYGDLPEVVVRAK